MNRSSKVASGTTSVLRAASAKYVLVADVASLARVDIGINDRLRATVIVNTAGEDAGGASRLAIRTAADGVVLPVEDAVRAGGACCRQVWVAADVAADCVGVLTAEQFVHLTRGYGRRSRQRWPWDDVEHGVGKSCCRPWVCRRLCGFQQRREDKDSRRGRKAPEEIVPHHDLDMNQRGAARSWNGSDVQVDCAAKMGRCDRDFLVWVFVALAVAADNRGIERAKKKSAQKRAWTGGRMCKC